MKEPYKTKNKTVTTIEKSAECNQPGCDGDLIYAGTINSVAMSPESELPSTGFLHRCDVCGHEEYFNDRYPNIEYVSAEQLPK